MSLIPISGEVKSLCDFQCDQPNFIPEILNCVFQVLEKADVLTCSLVNKEWYIASSNDELWKLFNLKVFPGYIHLFNSGQSISQKASRQKEIFICCNNKKNLQTVIEMSYKEDLVHVLTNDNKLVFVFGNWGAKVKMWNADLDKFENLPDPDLSYVTDAREYLENSEKDSYYMVGKTSKVWYGFLIPNGGRFGTS